MLIQFKCPDCGADMTFDAQEGVLMCASCGHKEQADELKQEPKYREVEDSTEASTYGSESKELQYQCQSCGAVIITEPNTTATSCSFCGSPVVLGDKLSGALSPKYVVPFKISKQNAEETFKNWSKKLKLAPADFKADMKVKSLTGMYVPFWLYDLLGQGEAKLNATKSSTHREGEYEVTETKHYEIYRQVDLTYNKVPADASKKMPDTLMNKLEPYEYNDLKKFDTPYLAGYVSERYDRDYKEEFPRVEKRAESYMDNYIRDTVKGYDTVSFSKRNYQVRQTDASYTLFPVWMAYSMHNSEEHSFFMNGQTGKIVGDTPVSKGACLAWTALFAFIFAIIGGIIAAVTQGGAISGVGIGLIVGIIIGLIVVSSWKSSMKGVMTAGSSTYLNTGQSKVLRQYDHYTHTTTSKRKIENNNNN